MYKIIGADQKEYGPITGEQIRQWIAEGRVNAQTHACLEGTHEWKPLGMFPEFGFPTSPLVGNLPAPESRPVSMDEIQARDYTIDILSCISRGWASFKNNFGNLVIATLLLGVVTIVTGVAVQIILFIVGVNRLPFAQRQYLFTPVNLVANALVVWPVWGGFYSICLHAAREDRTGTDISNLFIGFKNTFSDLFILRLVTGLVLAVCMLPYSIKNAEKMAPFMEQFEHMQQTSAPANPTEMILQMFSQMSSAFMATLPIFVVCMIVATYFSVNWIFALPLIVDRQMGFWAAMKTSWKIVHKHWFHIFGLAVLIGLLDLAGGLACCVGLLVTFPLGVTTLMFAYEDIFRRKTA
jgi:Membrane domain of glycerophosphoryl diester phosphodiesterase/GYF domain 2